MVVINLRLLKCEVDIILKALMEYNNIINEKYNYRKVSLTEEESTEKFMARNVYEHILCCKADITNTENIENTEFSKLKKAN